MIALMHSPKTGDVERPTDNQVVGNVGLFYTCYQLSRLGWNCMPTARNARGVDILIYSQDTKRKYTVQVKTLSKLAPVPLGKHLDQASPRYDKPRCFVLFPSEIKSLAHHGERDGRKSVWLQPRAYATTVFEEAWSRIGDGRVGVPTAATGTTNLSDVGEDAV
jgi:hypothetical protein